MLQCQDIHIYACTIFVVFHSMITGTAVFVLANIWSADTATDI